MSTDLTVGTQFSSTCLGKYCVLEWGLPVLITYPNISSAKGSMSADHLWVLTDKHVLRCDFQKNSGD